MFIDRAKVKVNGGRGGDGCVSFRREKFIPKGGPDGGDGGPGGSVIFRAVTGEQSLVDLKYQPFWKGGKGENGKGKNRHGGRGSDTIVDVPVGTLVKVAATGEELADLTEPGQEAVVARGGAAGRGNPRFATSRRRAPRIASRGEEGEERELEVVLKVIADVGLVGYPNAGKSTLLTAVSDAHPKTASYPFTTLHPVVGVVQFPDFFRFTIADIPGLIKGAHENVGLGHEFLRHIERARVLVYVLDTAGVDERSPWDDLEALRTELEYHQKGLTCRPSLIVANKMDLPQAAENLQQLRQRVTEPILPLSALTNESTDALVQRLRDILEKMEQETASKEPAVPGDGGDEAVPENHAS